MILLFLTSGLFLGWSLGANDASNAFGSAVGSKMVSFRTAAIIASIAVILGAVMQGSGTSQTLGKLGSVNAIGGSFTLALASAVTVYLMTKLSIPVSTTQAIVGAIIGWNLFTGNRTDAATLSTIVISWISGPVLGALFAIPLFIFITAVKKRSGIHLIRFESYIRTGLIITGAFAAYSLGANNIANVMGVFLPAFNLQELNLGIISLNSSQQLFLLGGIAIATGIITYSKKVMQTVGASIVELSPEAAMVVVLAQSLVLFVFSSSSLSSFLKGAGLPSIPLVPISSSQVIIGCVLGIGIYRGVRNINFRLLGQIGAGWIATPVITCILTYLSLFFFKNMFNIDVGHRITEGAVSPGAAQTVTDPVISDLMRYLLLGILAAGFFVILYYYILERNKRKELQRSEIKFWKNIK
ncbi:MAG TPA: inorganic phosphate transporter [Bacteroidales bacterium]|nr:inorganic phosphate transporter [Bacteroidales bacterium]HOX74648.1 inorganic phosphate transporter [Bacteroidales bacterium]HPM87684.1 inorganic phosphate transporter [Bacteroidales bacterium]HQM69136.1 inorganic phosphate transporter [Bacteroidales bacterium]